ncbi:MAG: hypothetical protein BWK76_28375 [Desulfobulbaceae bacterium A2]|nr:MAG: hypothetical protein BWK76_28375 [Desulfobulbaceae bacterium A2]
MDYKVTPLGKALAAGMLLVLSYGLVTALRPGTTSTSTSDLARGRERVDPPAALSAIPNPGPPANDGGASPMLSASPAVISPSLAGATDSGPMASSSNSGKSEEGACDQFARACRLTVYYPPHSTAIDKSYLPDLERFASQVKRLGVYQVRVEGNCALLPGQVVSAKQKKYYQSLSETRARQVAGYLQSQGLTSDMLDVRGNSSSSQIGDNSTTQYRFHNRRTDVFLVTR